MNVKPFVEKARAELASRDPPPAYKQVAVAPVLNAVSIKNFEVSSIIKFTKIKHLYKINFINLRIHLKISMDSLKFKQ